MKDLIQKIADRQDLTPQEAEKAMSTIMRGKATDAQIGAFLLGMRIKGESVGEITAFAHVLREFAVKVRPRTTATLVDTCGTGGDLSKTFNISTIASLVACGAGATVAKHGNRSVSSSSGSADVLEAMGVKIDLGPEGVETCIERVGYGFIFAPVFHTAMKYAAGPRRELGIRTVFNILGPLANPADVKAQVFGVYEADMTEKVAQVLRKLGCRHAMVVHGHPGMDEFSTLGKTRISELAMGTIATYVVSPDDFGLRKASIKDIRGGTPEENAKIGLNILDGNKGLKRDIVVLNAAAALLVSGIAEDFDDGIELAKESIDSGMAMKKLNQLIELSQSLK